MRRRAPYLEPVRTVLLLVATTALTGCFPHQPGPRLTHFDGQAPKLEAPAPPFELRSVDGQVVALDDLVGEQPIVLQLGSRSCPVFRNRRHWVEGLIEDYGDRVRFLVVYTLEAHPVGSKSPYDDEEWLTLFNRMTGVRVPQASTDDERMNQAKLTRDRLYRQSTVLVDTMDNEIWSAYGGASSPAFVIDRDGRVALRQVWIDPGEIRRTLDRLLAPTLPTPAAEHNR